MLLLYANYIICNIVSYYDRGVPEGMAGARAGAEVVKLAATYLASPFSSLHFLGGPPSKEAGPEELRALLFTCAPSAEYDFPLLT